MWFFSKLIKKFSIMFQEEEVGFICRLKNASSGMLPFNSDVVN